jgi:hypothetical protein
VPDFDETKSSKSLGIIFDDPSLSKASKDPYYSMTTQDAEEAEIADSTEIAKTEETEKDPKKLKTPNINEKMISKVQEIVPQDPKYDIMVHESKYLSTPNGDKRDYAFPRQDSLGMLLTAGGETKDATGRCSVPRAERVGLVVSDYLVQHPTLLEKFAPNELTLLDLNKSRVAGPAFFRQIGRFFDLKFLNLYDTHFQPSDYPVFINLKELRYLNVAWTAVKCKELLRYVAPQNIYSLDISGAEDGGELVRNIQKFPKIQQLVMFSCNLHNKDLVALRRSKLRSLCLMWNPELSDQAFESLCEIKTLIRLDISYLHLSPQCWRYLVKMPKLQKVKLGNMPWSTSEKLYFANQMRAHAPEVMMDFSSNYYQDFTLASTDIPWINEGADVHKLPTWVWFMRKRDKTPAH